MKKIFGLLACTALFMAGTMSAEAALPLTTNADGPAYAMTKQLLDERGQKANLIFSPYSLQQMMPLIRDNTTAKTVRAELLPYSVPGIRTEQLLNTKTGELILLDKSLAPEYTKQASGDIRLVDYPEEALKEKKDFQMRILDSVIDGDAPAGNLTFLTAAHYYAEWATKFDKHLTRQRSFTDGNGDKRTVLTMKKHFKNGIGKLTKEYDMAAVDGKNQSVVYFIKPKVDAGVTAGHLEQIVSDFENGVGTVSNIDLEVPKISLKNKLDLKPLLKEMGLTSFFDGRLCFDKITGSVPYVLANASQTATLDVNEDYAEGKAVTEIGFCTTSLAPEPIIYPIKMDRPYFIVIKDQTKEGVQRVVFTAWISQPEAK